MAVNETWLNHDMMGAVKVQYLDGNVFSQDNSGNLIGVHLTKNGTAYSDGGSVSANVIRADGATVFVSGALSGQNATVVLPQSVYAVPGVLSVVIKLAVSGAVTTIAAVVANVYQSSTDTVVDPGTIIPSVETLIAEIDAAVASIPADYSSLWTSLAPAFSSSVSYAVGQYVTYNGGLYRFISEHSGSWSSGDVTSVNVGSDLADIYNAVSQNTYNNDTVYYRNDMVLRNGKLYKRKSSTLSADGQWLSGRWNLEDLSDDIGKLNKAIFPLNNPNLLLSAKDIQIGKYYNGSQFVNNDSYIVFIVPVVSGTTYFANHLMRYVAKAGTLINENVFRFTATFTGDVIITFQNNFKTYVLTDSADYSAAMPWLHMGNRMLHPYQPLFDDRNYYNANKYLKTGAYYDPQQGGEKQSDTYSYFVIPVISGQHYYFNNFRFLTKVSSRIVATESDDYDYQADFTGDVYVSVRNSNPWICSKQSIFTDIIPYNFFPLLQEPGSETTRTMSQAAITAAIASAASSGSVLIGKKWTACGDSFTEGDFTGLQESDYTFQDAPYLGENMVYPFWIGRRTGCIVTNEAKSGSTLAYIEGRSNCFSAANGRYTQIASDAEYITLYFGINDSHQNVPIGTINDNTNTTFFGAWNIVLEYLITNHPNAKIGIIVSNGCDSVDYPNATIAAAKKWGIPYFDMNGDYTIPLVFRVNGKPDIAQSVLDLRKTQYRVSSSNNHPNVACHKDESTFIQAWLESI